MILTNVTRIDADGRSSTGRHQAGSGTETVDGSGLLLLPGLIDLHAHLREPGFEESETIATGAHAALRGGFTTVCAMPNTQPAMDAPGLVAELTARARVARGARVLPVAAITRGRAGHELADLVELAAAGAVAFSDDGDPVDDARLFRSALEYARGAGRPVFEHSQDRVLSGRGVMHEGAVSADLGLAGLSPAAEETAIARDIAIARATGARLHLQHVSTAAGIDLVRSAKAAGASVTCEVTPHHLALLDEWVAGSRRFAWEPVRGASPPQAPRGVPYDSATKVNPPLRGEADVRALWAGLADGTVDAIATDHAPHASIRKDVEYAEAAFGISGIETALSVLLMAIDARMGELSVVVRALTSGPARVLGLALTDDAIVVDPLREWTVSVEALASRGKNTPLLGRRLRGRVVAAIVDGEVRYADPAWKGARRAEAVAR
ncbi:MAG: dihydroorotase [Chloroflexi bacterium]|nr:dihydroorotase [Chloroflexota bacterium]